MNANIIDLVIIVALYIFALSIIGYITNLMYISIRFGKVIKFLDEINNKLYSVDNVEEDIEKLNKIYNKYKIDDLLYSFKPLKLKYWFTEEEITIIERRSRV